MDPLDAIAHKYDVAQEVVDAIGRQELSDLLKDAPIFLGISVMTMIAIGYGNIAWIGF